MTSQRLLEGNGQPLEVRRDGPGAEALEEVAVLAAAVFTLLGNGAQLTTAALEVSASKWKAAGRAEGLRA